jgi:hypothetical protein
MTDAQIVLGVCGANAAETQVLEITERLNTLDAYADMTSKEVSDLAGKLERRTVAAGRAILPTILVKNIQALCFWAREKQRTMQPLIAADFTAATLRASKELMRQRVEDQADTPSIKPEKFKASTWKVWTKQFVTYLSNCKGAQYAPLDYVIRTEPQPAAALMLLMPDRERELYTYPLTGPHYKEDSRAVYRLLSDLVAGTVGFVWISEYNRAQNGRTASWP